MRGLSRLAFLSILAACAVFTATASGNPDYLNQIWQRVEFGTYIGSTHIWSLDLDGNGSEEMNFA